MFLSLSFPLLMGIVTRLALRPRGQGQQNVDPASIGWLAGGFIFSFIFALWAMMKAGLAFQPALLLTVISSAAGLLLPEIFRGTGAAVTAALSRPRNWLWLMGIGAVVYGLLVDPKILEGIFLLGMTLFFLGVILGWNPFKKKKGGG